MVATWNVLNLENWQNTMYGVVRETNYGSSMFFVFWIIIGKQTLTLSRCHRKHTYCALLDQHTRP